MSLIHHCRFDLIIFDCDGVLVDSEPAANRILAEALSEEGLPTTWEESIRDFMGKSMADVRSIIARRLGRDLPDAFFQRLQRLTRQAFDRELKPVAGIEEALAAIPTLKCVASSGSPEKIAHSLDLTGLSSFFTGRVFSAVEVERGKPYPDLFLHAARQLGVVPGRCAVVEDSLPGVQAAVAAGMTVFGYAALASAEQLTEAGARTFGHMRELPALLWSI